jgi:fatty acid synthase, animal type
MKNIGSIPSNSNENLLMKDDFYKELKIRGYQYKDDFRNVEKIQNFVQSTKRYGEIEWKGNFACFVDAMGQVMFTNCDNRELMLPTFIKKAVFNQEKHNQMIEDLENCRKEVDEDGNERIFFDLLIDENLNMYRSGGVEIIGIETQIVSRKKAADPILETYEFITYSPTPILTVSNVVKFCIQIFLENSLNIRHNFVELIEDEFRKQIVFLESMVVAFKETLLSTVNFHLFTNSKLDEIKDVKISDLNEFKNFENVDFLIVTKWNDEYVEKLNENGMILLRSEETIWQSNQDLKKIADVQMETENLLLLRKTKLSNFIGETFEIPITQESFEWIEHLKKVLEKSDDIILYSRSEMSGILGFVKTLRKENHEKKLKCFIIEDINAPKFDPKIPFFAKQLDLGLAINIFKNGKWGNFHHLNFNQEVESKPQSNHAFVHLLNRGNLSSISWVNGDLNVDDESNIDVHYSALNFRDILVASSRISLDHIFANRKAAQYKIGLEFSGITKDGKRVAGLCESRSMSNSVKKIMISDHLMCMNVPDNISLEDAATIPAVYLTVYISFFMKGQVKAGQSILIHCGSGGLGQAAIQTALAYGMKVFTTCGSNEKREFLLKEFPKLKNEDIGNSRNTSFEQMIISQTNGRGVDYVLNSLVEDKMHASLRCLANNGTFLEVGKFDILMGNKITLKHFTRNIKYFAIDLSMKYLFENKNDVMRIYQQIENDIREEKIKPLNRTVFNANDVEKAFRYMTTGKHIGKVLLKIRESEQSKMSFPIQVKPQVFFDSKKSYVLVGGLGGMGMEIADWMIMRNCMKLVFSSSRGISNSYQSYRFRIWESYGVKVVISTADITTRTGCIELIETANKIGSIGGIFNMAAVLHDVKFVEQTSKTFEKSFKPKALSTKHLDEISRRLCPKLDHFVFFSSASGGRGHASQTNYGISNSVGEKIILNRYESGLCGKAIQFGPIRDVGLLSHINNNEITSFFGYSLQSITSCFDVFDKILLRDEPIFSSIVCANKSKSNLEYKDAYNTLLGAMGITDENSIDQNQTLAELGVDSISGIEIQQAFQREAGISMTLKEIRSKTFKEMKELSKSLDEKRRKGN